MAETTPTRKISHESVIRFEAALRSIGGRPIVRLTNDASAKLPSRGQVSVKGVLNQETFQTVLEPDGMRGHWLEVDAKTRHALALADGDIVTVELEPSKAWPEPAIPQDFEAALADAPDIAEPWRGITPMARWEWVRWINATNNPQTRKRRVEVSISKLRKGMRRPCCFDLAACTDPELSKNGRLIESA